MIPTALWLIWYLGWGREAQNFVSFHNFSTLPGYVGDGFSSSLSTPARTRGAARRDARSRRSTGAGRCSWSRSRLRSGGSGGPAGGRSHGACGPCSRWASPFWSLTGLNASFFGQATSGRYQYMGVVFILLIAAELLRGVARARAGWSGRCSPSRCSRRSRTSPTCATTPTGSPGSPRRRRAASRRSSSPGAGRAGLRAHGGQLGRRLPRGRRRRAVLLGDRRLRLAGLHARRARRRPTSRRGSRPTWSSRRRSG